jgi:hypothetical protein
MNLFETTLLGLLLGSFAVNLWLGDRLIIARAAVRRSRMVVTAWQFAFDELRANSHRRDPKTGRLMRKGA